MMIYRFAIQEHGSTCKTCLPTQITPSFDKTYSLEELFFYFWPVLSYEYLYNHIFLLSYNSAYKSSILIKFKRLSEFQPLKFFETLEGLRSKLNRKRLKDR